MHDLRSFLHAAEAIVARHRLASPGSYRRWLWQGDSPLRDLGLNPYGSADAANILYTLGRFPAEPGERQAWIETLQSLQEPGSGLYREPSHHPFHTTAHCLAALELFDARPLHPLQELAPYEDPSRMERFLEELDWAGNPWNASHQGAGLYVALVLAGAVDLACTAFWWSQKAARR